MTSLYHVLLVRYVRGFVSLDVLQNFRGKGNKAKSLSLAYTYQLVVINSHFYLYVVVPLLYTAAYSRGCGLVGFSLVIFYSLQPGV